jgi:hypothetical protein
MNCYQQQGEEIKALRDEMMRETAAQEVRLSEPVTRHDLTAAPLTNASPVTLNPPPSPHMLSPITLRTRAHRAREADVDPARRYAPSLHDSTVAKLILAMRIKPADAGYEFTDQERADEINAAIKRHIEKDFPPDPPMNRPRRRRKK